MGGSHSSVRRGALVALVAVGTIALAGSAVTIPPPPQAYAGWPHQLGGVDTDLASKVATLSSGDVIVVGSTTGTMPNGSPHGFNDGYIARLDKGGSVKWLRQIGTTGQDGASAVAVSGSSIYVAGGTDGTFPNTSPLGGTDTYVTRYDTNGNFKWLRLLTTGGDDSPAGIAVSGTSVYVAGTTNGAFTGFTNASGNDSYLVRFDSSGNLKWTRQFGPTSHNENLNDVAVSGSSVYVIGSSEESATGSDVFVARYNSSGTQVWYRQFGTPTTDVGMAVALSGGAVYLAGSTHGFFPDSGPISNLGDDDAWVARYDSAGNRSWIRQFGTDTLDNGWDVSVRSGAVYVVGSTYGDFPGFPNPAPNSTTQAYLARFSTSGTPTWTRAFGTNADESGLGVALRSSNSNGGAVVVVGATLGSVWGQTSGGSLDGYVATFPG